MQPTSQVYQECKNRLTVFEQRLNDSERKVMMAESSGYEYKKQVKKNVQITSISLGSTATVAGGALSVVFPPVGIPLMIGGFISLLTGAIFRGKQQSQHCKAKKIQQLMPNLTYKQACKLAKHGKITILSNGKEVEITNPLKR